MRELAFIRAIASVLLELEADLVFMELLVEMSTKLVREFHNKIEILSRLTLAWNTTSTTSPVIYSPISRVPPSFPVQEQTVLEEPSSADRWEAPTVSEHFVVVTANVLFPSQKSASLETEVPDCLKMMEHLG